MEEQVNIPALYVVWFLLHIFKFLAHFGYMRVARRRQSLRVESTKDSEVSRKGKNR